MVIPEFAGRDRPIVAAVANSEQRGKKKCMRQENRGRCTRTSYMIEAEGGQFRLSSLTREGENMKELPRVGVVNT